MAKIDAATRKFTLNDIMKYNQYRREIQDIKREIILGSGQKFEEVDVTGKWEDMHHEYMPKGEGGIGRATESKAIQIVNHDRLTWLERIVDAIERATRMHKDYKYILKYSYILKYEDVDVAKVIKSTEKQAIKLRQQYLLEVAKMMGRV